MKTQIIKAITCLTLAFAFLTFNTNAQQTDIIGPAGSDSFGRSVTALPNGNIVVTDPEYDIPAGAANVGAVYLYDGSNGNLISTLTGSTADDRVGSDGVTVLTNGNYVVGSPSWDGTASDVGAVTFGNGTTGISGTVSSSNSLVGSTADDRIGEDDDFFPRDGVTALTNGNYVVNSPFWDGTASDVGAVTFGNGTTGISGTVSSTNSLVGSTADDLVGRDTVTALTNGNYVVSSGDWDGTTANVGAATFGNGTTGISGTVSSSNSLVGSTADDNVGISGATALTNGNYVVSSGLWNGTAQQVGAVTFGDGTTGISGTVSSSNSLVGSTAFDGVGFFGLVTALTNGNYVVSSSNWNGTASGVGAVTFGDGTTGISGTVSSSNSLVGSTEDDRVGIRGATALTNGNYVVSSQNWDGTAANVGAVTFGDGTSGISGTVSSSNSLVGSTAGDRVGIRVATALTNGNYVVRSPSWDGTAANVGAVTFGNGTTGISGTVSSSNSLVGSTENDQVGTNGAFNEDGVTALTNGNYVVHSPNWDGTAIDVGAVTFGDGTTGITGTVSSTNSLVGSTAADNVGSDGATALTNGNYVVSSSNWNGTASGVGAVTFGDGTNGITGMVSSSNSLVGSTANDNVSSGGVFAFTGGNYAVISPNFDNGGDADVGAVTYLRGQTGNFAPLGNSKTNSKKAKREIPNSDDLAVSMTNSVIGTTPNGGGQLNLAFDLANDQLVVGRPADNIVTLFSLGSPPITPANALFDFDGDGRSDISVFRPDPNDIDNNYWKVLQSSSNSITEFEWGIAADADSLVPADYDGDGKTDIAVYRKSENNFYIYNSSDNSTRIENFGITGDKLTVADWDNDGKADLSVYREGSQSYFYFRASSNNPNSDITNVPWGITGDKPVNGDFDGDGIQDAAVFRPSNRVWYILQSSNGQVRYVNFGLATDKLIPADYDGDAKTDIAVFRNGVWYILQSANNQINYQYFGLSNDTLVPADYDGDGKTDVAVFRNGIWYINQTTSGFTSLQFGLSNDKAIPNAYVNQ